MTNALSRRHQAGSRQTLAQALLAIAAAGASYAWAMGLGPPAVARQLAAPEAMLVRALLDIGESRFSAALEQIDKLLASNPNFRLAQLVKGDLLLARSRPINSIGNASGAPSEQVDGLREEARARLARYQIETPRELAPRYLLQMPQKQKYALVLDSAKSTLFLFENIGGAAHYVADYYVTIGKNGLEKLRQGDKRTPIGVYHVVSQLPRDKLSDFYGSGAFPLNYPNEWDRVRGRDGSGIWLHGTPRDTYSRPPRASDGCIVLANADLEALARKLQIGSTPVVIADALDWARPGEVEALKADLLITMERWRRDWESRDTETYLGHYAVNFSSNDMTLVQWSAQKRQVNASKAWIKVQLSDVSLLLYPGKEEIAVATFDQDYASSNLSNRMTKRQYWIKEGGKWRIVYEGAA
ncbi:MAG TPA: L,D-transpeptidase family protein [Burkholderiales bacterium]|nr:L,D-transpeptidase family protein [Burkholderiales bacterium]